MSDGMWGYQPTTGHTAGLDLTGFKVEATDGTIGKVDKHSDAADSSYVVVDIGLWIFGKHVFLPAGTVQRVDRNEQKVYVSLTKDQIKESPEFDQGRHVGDADYHERVGGYYHSVRTI